MKASQKAKLTRKKNLELAKKQMGLETSTVKKRKKRKPMTEEQRKAAAARLEKARANRKVKNTSIHEKVKNLPDDDPLSATAVKGWLKYNRDKLKTIRSYKESSKKAERSEYLRVQSYIRNLQIYLRTGVYLDFEAGSEMQERMKEVCLVKAYNSDGTVKRTVNRYYDDIGLWTQQMEDDANGRNC